MKKLFLLLMLAFSLSMNAQHLKFMGIPIDGTVNTFAAKLKTKGFSVASKNKYAGTGLRIMEGRFFNQSAEIWINYIPSSKTVYSVRVVFWSDDRDVCESFQEEIESAIEDKYYYIDDTGKTNGGDDIDVYHIVDSERTHLYGDIYIGISQASDYYGYYLNLTYEDWVNSNKNDNRKSSDI